MKRRWFYFSVLLQVLFLVLMSVSFYAMDSFGQSIKLKTAPVDPRDPFYGDYVTLGYEVEQINEKHWTGKEEMQRGDPVFLLLEADDQGIYQVVEASSSTMAAEGDQVHLKATFDWFDQNSGTYRVDIGLDRYYIEENTGGQFDDQENQVVEIILAPWGQKKIVSIE